MLLNTECMVDIILFIIKLWNSLSNINKLQWHNLEWRRKREILLSHNCNYAEQQWPGQFTAHVIYRENGRLKRGTYKVRNEIETKRGTYKVRNEIETKRNATKSTKTKRNATKSTKAKRNETKSTKTKRNKMKPTKTKRNKDIQKRR